MYAILWFSWFFLMRASCGYDICFFINKSARTCRLVHFKERLPPLPAMYKDHGVRRIMVAPHAGWRYSQVLTLRRCCHISDLQCSTCLSWNELFHGNRTSSVNKFIPKYDTIHFCHDLGLFILGSFRVKSPKITDNLNPSISDICQRSAWMI